MMLCAHQDDDLVPFLQFKKREKYRWRSITFRKVAGFQCNFTESNTPRWMFFKLYKWYYIVERITYLHTHPLNLELWPQVLDHSSFDVKFRMKLFQMGKSYFSHQQFSQMEKFCFSFSHQQFSVLMNSQKSLTQLLWMFSQLLFSFLFSLKKLNNNFLFLKFSRRQR